MALPSGLHGSWGEIHSHLHFPYRKGVIALSREMLSRLFLCLSFRSLTVMCLGVNFLLGVHSASWICRNLISFAKFATFSIIISSSTFSTISSFSSLSRTPMAEVLDLSLQSKKFLKLCAFLFSVYFFSVVQLDNSHFPIFQFTEFSSIPSILLMHPLSF